MWCICKTHRLPLARRSNQFSASVGKKQRRKWTKYSKMQYYKSSDTTKQYSVKKIKKWCVTSYLSSGRNGLFCKAPAFFDDRVVSFEEVQIVEFWVKWGGVTLHRCSLSLRDPSSGSRALSDACIINHCTEQRAQVRL